MSMSLTTMPLLAGSITSTESPATFCTFLHSRAWSWPISTMSKPGTLRATSSEAFSRYLPPISKASCPAWNIPITISGRSFRGLSSSTCGRSLPCRQTESPPQILGEPHRNGGRYHAENGNLHSVALQHLVGPEVGFARSGIDDVGAQHRSTAVARPTVETARPVSTSWLPILAAS